MTRTFKIICAALLISSAMVSCLAKEAPAQQSRHSLLASKLMPQQSKARSARSLSDMFERVKNRIFGKKQSSQTASASSISSSAIQPAASANSQQRQPWDLNSFNQQYNPYSALSNGNFQWPVGSSSMNNQFMSQPYGSLNSASSGFQSPQTNSAGSILGLDAISQVSGASQSGANGQQISQLTSSPSGANGGLFSSASHLIAQYLSPSSSSSSTAQQASSGSSSLIGGQQQQQQQQSGGQQQAASQSMLTPQQQQQQNQYQEFASILDSMVAQTGASNPVQRQPSAVNQFGVQQQSSMQPQTQGQQQQGPFSGSQSMSSQPGSMMGADNDMSSSNNVQSYMPAATQQQASQKSSMVSLAEQLAPGAQFNKLISFPFSLSPNDDATKEGRYKLHIPFLNQHVKRSDQQASGASLSVQQKAQQQQQVQQYLNQLYSQQQQQQQQPSYSTYGQAQQSASSQQQQQQQLSAQASQAVPTIVSPSQSAGASPVSSQPNSSPSSSATASASQPSAVSSAVAPAQSSSSATASSSSSSSAVGPAANQRSNWSVADTQSNAVSSSKLIPIQLAAAASSVEVVPQN